MNSVRCTVHPANVSALKELVDRSSATGQSLHFELRYTGTSMDDIAFDMIVVDTPNVAFLSGTAKLKGGAGAGRN